MAVAECAAELSVKCLTTLYTTHNDQVDLSKWFRFFRLIEHLDGSTPQMRQAFGFSTFYKINISEPIS